MKKILFLTFLFHAACFGQGTISWEPEIPVADGSVYGNLRPRIVLTADNTPLVVFSKSSSGDVHAARWNGSGFDSPIRLNPTDKHAYVATWTGPDVAAKGDTVIVVYKDSDLENGHVYSVRSSDGGITFSDTIRVDSHPAGVAWLPALDIDENGDPSVIYMGHDPVWVHPRYFVTHSTDQGLSYEPEMDIAASLPNEACDCCPAEYVINDHRHVVLFRNNASNIRDIYGIYSYDDGLSYPVFQDLEQLNWDILSCPSTAPHGLLRENDLLTVSSSAASGEYRVSISKSTADTDLTYDTRIAMTPPLNTNGIQNYPRITGKGDTVVVVWQESEGSAMDIMCALTTQNVLNDLLGTKHTVNTNTSSSQSNPDVVYKDGMVHLVFQDALTGDVIYKRGVIGTAGKIEQTIKQLVLFPNPSLSGKFLLKGAKTIDCLSVSDEFGKRVEATIEMYHDSLSIDLSEFANGIYELTIQDGSSIHYFELINLK